MWTIFIPLHDYHYKFKRSVIENLKYKKCLDIDILSLLVSLYFQTLSEGLKKCNFYRIFHEGGGRRGIPSIEDNSFFKPQGNSVQN